LAPGDDEQGCQIFIGETYQNGKKYTKKRKTLQMAMKHPKLLYLK
jgi:hypothetical protein